MIRFKKPSPTDYNSLRELMVEKQLKPRGIHDEAVLAAMGKVPRHEFVTESLRSEAYDDHPLPIDHEQTISQPYIVASMTQELKLNAHSIVLEVGTGCGYQTAVLAEIVKHVYTIECIPDLFKEADSQLKSLGYNYVTAKVGDGSKGWIEHAPFDGIIVTAAAREVPPDLMSQLKDGGLMIIPIEISRYHQDLYLIQKTGDQFKKRNLYGVRFVPLRTNG